MTAKVKRELGGEDFPCLRVLNMKGVTMRFRGSIVPTVTLLVMSVSFFGSAETKTIDTGEATASWNGNGTIEDLGDWERIFRGMINGTMFIRHPDEAVHTGFMRRRSTVRPPSVSAKTMRNGRAPSA